MHCYMNQSQAGVNCRFKRVNRCDGTTTQPIDYHERECRHDNANLNIFDVENGHAWMHNNDDNLTPQEQRLPTKASQELSWEKSGT